MNKESKQSRPMGRKIRDLRKEKGMNIRELAEEVGISRSYLSHIELESAQNPPIETVRKIAGSLDVSVSQLLGEKSKTKTSDNSSFGLPFSQDELKEMAESERATDQYLSLEGLSPEAKDTLRLFKGVLADPDIPIQKLNHIREEMISHAKWLRAKAKNEVPEGEDDK